MALSAAFILPAPALAEEKHAGAEKNHAAAVVEKHEDEHSRHLLAAVQNAVNVTIIQENITLIVKDVKNTTITLVNIVQSCQQANASCTITVKKK